MSEVAGQISMFNMIPEDDWHTQALRKNLKGGMFGWSSSRIRVWIASQRLDRDRFADYLQNEYGICGGSIEHGSIQYNFRGAHVLSYETNEEKHYTWAKIRNMVLDIINSGEYLTQDDWKKIDQIKAEHGGLLPLEPPNSLSIRKGGDEDGTMAEGE